MNANPENSPSVLSNIASLTLDLMVVLLGLLVLLMPPSTKDEENVI